jgi:hypothetical protein
MIQSELFFNLGFVCGYFFLMMMFVGFALTRLLFMKKFILISKKEQQFDEWMNEKPFRRIFN